MKTKTKEDYEDDAKSLMRKRDKLIIEIDKVQNELLDLTETITSMDPDYVKVECLKCRGVGYIQGDDNKKHICDLCQGKQYNYMRRYNEE